MKSSYNLLTNLRVANNMTTQYIIQPAEFINQLHQFFKNTHNSAETLIVDSIDHRSCIYMEIDSEPSAQTLPEPIEIGYVLFKNKVYFVEKHLNKCSLLKELSSEELVECKNRLNYRLEEKANKPILLLDSQLAYLAKLTKHHRTTQFLKIAIKNDALCLQFGANNKALIIDDQSKLHPILSILYTTLKSYNDQHVPATKRVEQTNEQQTSELYTFIVPDKTRNQKLVHAFTWLKEGIRNMLRVLLFDNVVFKHTIGALVALIANYGNPHYRTEPGTLSNILSGLIFPGGTTKPQVTAKGTIILESAASNQFNAMARVEAARNKNGQFEFDHIQFDEFAIQMPDHSYVASVSARNDLAKNKDINECVYVVAFNGNGGCYQSEMVYDAYALRQYEAHGIPVELIRFNYPGVLNSTGYPYTAEELINAGIAQVQRLLDKGVKPEHIQIQGMSLGGSISSYVANYYHERGQTLGGLCVSRTFSSTTNVAISYLDRLPYAGTLLSFLLRPLMALGLWATKWHLDTARNVANHPDNKTWFTIAHSPKVIRKSYDSMGKTILDDNVLEYSSSIHKSWRIQLKHALGKYFGLFGYKSEYYKEMNAAHKLVAVHKMDESDDSILSYEHCAHADVRPFGLNKYTHRDHHHTIRASEPMLLVRDKQKGSSSIMIKTLASSPSGDGQLTIPSSIELGQQTVQFLVEHIPEKWRVSNEATYFGRFFKSPEERDTSERVISSLVQTAINLIP